MDGLVSTKKTNNEALIREAHERFQQAQDAEYDRRVASLEDLEFSVGEQWPLHLRQERAADNRPCLTINRLPQFIKQICNEQRQNRPAIQISPVDDGGDPETAEILQGCTRHVEAASNADIAYDTAFEFAVRIGFGWFRILTEYCDPESFDVEARFEAITNPFTVYIDPHAKRADRSDMQWAFIIEDIPEAEYRRLYPDSQLAGLPDFGSIGDTAADWVRGGTVRIAEYFRIEHTNKTLVELEDGTIGYSDSPQVKASGAEVKRARNVRVPRVMWSKINAVEELEGEEFPCDYIPLVPVLGDEINVDGKLHLIGIVRYAKDAQRAYNYWLTNQTETIALAPRVPYIGAVGQFEGLEKQWANANRKNLAFLQYNPVRSAQGDYVPPPQRQSFEPPVQALSMARMQAIDDLKATTGLYNASLGEEAPAKSGRALLAQQQEGDTATFHFIDNLARSIRHAGRIVLSIIMRAYDTARVIRIIGEDQSTKVVRINQLLSPNSEKKYDFTTGKYDVTVSTGPSYTSKRQQAVEAMLELTKAYPQLAEVCGDLLVSNMDWPGAKKIAERLKKLLPPNIQDEGDGNEPNPQLLMQQAQQQEELIGQLTAALEDASKQLEQKKIENDTKFRIVQLQEETRRMLGLVNATQKAEAVADTNSVKVLQMRTAAVSHQVDIANQAEQQERAAEIQGEQMQQQQAHDAQQLTAQQQHASSESQADRDAAAAQAAAAMPKAA